MSERSRRTCGTQSSLLFCGRDSQTDVLHQSTSTRLSPQVTALVLRLHCQQISSKYSPRTTNTTILRQPCFVCTHRTVYVYCACAVLAISSKQPDCMSAEQPKSAVACSLLLILRNRQNGQISDFQRIMWTKLQ